MKPRVFRRNPLAALAVTLAPLLLTAAIIAIVFAGITQTREADTAEGVRLLEEALTRVTVHSYAVRGYFPESLDYIVETYGIHIDTRRFLVHFDVFAPNILPDIRVFAR